MPLLLPLLRRYLLKQWLQSDKTVDKWKNMYVEPASAMLTHADPCWPMLTHADPC